MKTKQDTHFESWSDKDQEARNVEYSTRVKWIRQLGDEHSGYVISAINFLIV